MVLICCNSQLYCECHFVIDTCNKLFNIVQPSLHFIDIYTGFVCYKRVRIMVFNATFKSISVISWWLVLLVEETRVPTENH